MASEVPSKAGAEPAPNPTTSEPGGTATAAQSPEQPKEPAPSTPPPPPDMEKLIAALTTLYTSTDNKAKDVIVDDFYAKKPTFIDNVTHVSGQHNIKVQFHALTKMLKDVKFSPTSHEVEQVGDKHIVKIQNVQEYVMGPTVTKFDVLTTLELDSQGKITKHSDEWQGQWGCWSIIKRTMGFSSSMVMRMLRV